MSKAKLKIVDEDPKDLKIKDLERQRKRLVHKCADQKREIENCQHTIKALHYDIKELKEASFKREKKIGELRYHNECLQNTLKEGTYKQINPPMVGMTMKPGQIHYVDTGARIRDGSTEEKRTVKFLGMTFKI